MLRTSMLLSVVAVTLLALTLQPLHDEGQAEEGNHMQELLLVEWLTMHYIQNLVAKPESNHDLLILYKKAFKNLELTIKELKREQ